MTVSEIFEKISTRQIEGMMLHNDMANYYDFLGLKGYKRMHEYHYLCESIGSRKTNRYFINNYDMMIKPVPVNSESHIPMIWFDYSRIDVEPDSKREAVKSSVDKWINWKHETMRHYEQLFAELMTINEVEASFYVHKLAKDARKELKYAKRLRICLKSVGYDLDAIIESQNELHEYFKCKSARIGGIK